MKKQSLDYSKSAAYFRDKFVPFQEANLSLASSAVLYGLSIYTVFNAKWVPEHKQLYVFRLPEHYARLVNAARIMGFEDFSKKYTQAEFIDLCLELLRQNQVQEDALVRATIFIDELVAGTRIDGLRNSLGMFVYPMGEILRTSGVHACVSSWRRVGDTMIPARAKVNGSYVNASLMKNEALLNGYDEAIALDAAGHVTEGTVANLFLVRHGRLVTPATDGDILEGITRQTILEIAANLKIPTEERSIDRTELYVADEMFMAGSSANITPVLSVDKRPVASGKVGAITRQLSQIYLAIRKGESKEYSNWLTPVYPGA